MVVSSDTVLCANTIDGTRKLTAIFWVFVSGIIVLATINIKH